MAVTGMEAVKAKIPSLAALARHLGVTRGAVAQWSRVPSERLIAVSRFTGLEPKIIRPDLYVERGEVFE